MDKAPGDKGRGKKRKKQKKADDPMKKVEEKEVITEDMRQYILEMLPEIATSPVFIPPQLFPRTLYSIHEKRSTREQEVCIQQKTPDSDHSADKAVDDVIQCLRHVVKAIPPKPMAILSNYPFGNYLLVSVSSRGDQLNSISARRSHSRNTTEVDPEGLTVSPPSEMQTSSSDESYAIHPSRRFAKAKTFFPNQENLKEGQKQGDFDVLIISKRYGFTVIEVKATGYDRNAVDNKALKENITSAMERQLSKAEEMLKHLFSDLNPNGVAVTKSVALPNIRREQLHCLFTEYPDLEQAAIKCFEVSTSEEALARFLCADEVAAISHGISGTTGSGGEATQSPESLLMTWWSRLLGGSTEGATAAASGGAYTEQFSQDTYLEIVARFCGPYSKVIVESRKNAPEARTVADCVHLTGLRFGRHILRQDQLDVLHSQDNFVFLTGPPGSGKTLILGLKAVEWARAGDHVVIIKPQGLGWGWLVSWTLYSQVAAAVTASARDSCEAAEVSKAGKATRERSTDAETEGSCKVPSTAGTAEKSGTTDNQSQDETSPSQTKSSNVHFEEIGKATDAEKFVRDLLTQYQGSPLRFVVDECPLNVNPERLHKQLEGSHKRLEVARESLKNVAESVQKQEFSGVSAEQDLKTGEAADAEKSKRLSVIKTYLKKIDHHLSEIKKRFQIIQPEHGKPRVTQTTEWKGHVSNIHQLCLDIRTYSQQLQTTFDNTTQQYEDNVAKDLETSEAKMLEASGLLFNVETNMNFFAFDDLLMTVSKGVPVRDMSLWASSVYPFYKPTNYKPKKLTRCIRCPPKIQQLLEHAEKDMSEQPNFSYQCTSLPDDRFSLPTDGPEVVLFDHSGHMTETNEIRNCRACGEKLADYITQLLDKNSNLRAEDFVISGNASPEFTRAIAGRNILLQSEGAHLTSPPPYKGRTFVAGGSTLQGLEAKIVVFIPDVSRIPAPSADVDNKQFRSDLPPWLRNLGRWNRCHLWLVASRCLSQLIVFHVERDENA